LLIAVTNKADQKTIQKLSDTVHKLSFPETAKSTTFEKDEFDKKIRQLENITKQNGPRPRSKLPRKA
jgi:hypothetical protein